MRIGKVRIVSLVLFVLTAIAVISIWVTKARWAPELLRMLIEKSGASLEEISGVGISPLKIDVASMKLTWDKPHHVTAVISDLSVDYDIQSLQKGRVNNVKAGRVAIEVINAIDEKQKSVNRDSEKSNESRNFPSNFTLPFSSVDVNSLSLALGSNIEPAVFLLESSVKFSNARLELNGTVKIPKFTAESRNKVTFTGDLNLDDGAAVGASPFLTGRLNSPAIDFIFPLQNISTSFKTSFAKDDGIVLGVDNFSLNVFDGTLSLKPFRYNPKASRNRIVVLLKNLNLEPLLARYPDSKISGTGRIDGELPISVSKSGPTIKAGTVSAKPPGGVLKGDLRSWAEAHPGNPGIELAVRALGNLHYDSLSAEVNYAESGDLDLKVSLNGSNPDLNQGHPLNVNINIGENIPALLQTIELINRGPEQFKDR